MSTILGVRRRCRKQLQHCRSSTGRCCSVRLLYVILVINISSTLCFYLLSGAFSNALHNACTQSESAVVLIGSRIVEMRHHINDSDDTNTTIQPSKTSLSIVARRWPSPALSYSTTNSLSSPPQSAVVLVHPSIKTMITDTSLTSSTTDAPPSLTTSDLSSLPITSASLLSTTSTAAVSNVPSPSSQPSITSDTLDVQNKYVSFYGGFADGRGLGNQMFDLAAVVYVSELTGRQPAILKLNNTIALDQVFGLRIKRFDNLCPCYVFLEEWPLRYDRRIEELVNGSLAEDSRDESIFLRGCFQSWKYTRNVERHLRHHFTFLPEIRQFVDKFLADTRPPGWVDGYVRVGIHVRRGDILNADKIVFGHTSANEQYFAHAMRYFVDRFDRVQFIVASNDIRWCRQKLAYFATTLPHRVDVSFLATHSTGKDFAVLASCEHVIMSTGTFGWWAAWLAGGITIYYADWPRNGSALASMFRREDFFPSTWIGMT